MITFGPVLLLALLITVGWSVTRHRHHPITPYGPVVIPPPIPTETVRPLPPRHGLARVDTAASSGRRQPDLGARLAVWRDAGLITGEQADRIASFERSRVLPVAAPPRRVPLVAEALGYLGGILGTVGLVLLVTRYWPDMAVAARLGLTVGGAAALGITGYLVHEHSDAALARLRWFLWVLSSAAGALAAGVFAHDVLDARAPWSIALACTLAVTLQNAVFWAGQERPVQQLLTMAAGVATAGLLVSQWSGATLTGFTVFAVALPLLAAGWRNLTTQPAITVAVGSTAALVGTVQVASDWHRPGLLLFVLTAAGLLLIAALPRSSGTAASRLVLTVVAAIGLMQAVPPTVVEFAEVAGVATGVTVWTTGVGLLVVGMRRWLRQPIVAEILGGAAIVAGAAITSTDNVGFATLFGLTTAVTLLAVGTLPGRVLMSLFGSVGLLVNVPWAITHFFPGEGRAPLLILASGAVIVAVAVWLARQGGRLRDELRPDLPAGPARVRR